MPTGYTAGILDGKITTFPQFAKQCMRAFGATIHMRDDDMDAEYKPRVPSNYHKEEIQKSKKIINDFQIQSNEVIENNKKIELKENKKYHLKSIENAKKQELKLKDILSDVKKWIPPTEEHQEIKIFMIQQIESTIDFDCKSDYHKENLILIDNQLKKLNGCEIRKQTIKTEQENIQYHLKEHKKELERCKSSNKWMTDLLKSLK